MVAASEFRPVSASVFESEADPVVFDDDTLAMLIEAAQRAPNGRSRLILHSDRNDSLHEMVIALPADSCDHPHINYKSGKSFLALSGQFAVMRFSDDGEDIVPTVLSAGPWPGARMVRLRSAAWHTIIPLEGDTVFLETIIGPFTGNQFAPWYPGENEPARILQHADKLRAVARAAADRYQ